jgi:hypothetical protein
MNIDEFKDNIIEYINYSHEDTTLELEAILKPTYSEPINLDDFTRLLKRLKPLSVRSKKTESLDIMYEYQPGKQSNIRISILGKQNIKKYCETNSINKLDERYVNFLRKQRVKVVQELEEGVEQEVFLKPIDIDNYNIRLNLKSENNISRNHQNVMDILDAKTWNNKRKFFRYKNRYSFELPNKNFVFDITIVKTSDIKLIESEDRKIRKFVYTKNIQDSNVFKNDEIYEIELEYIGNKKKLLGNSEDIIKEMFKYIGFMLQSHQKSYFLCGKQDRKLFRDEYSSLLKQSKYKGFQGPNPITIETKHLQKRSYIEYKENVINIRRNYSVTDKADGERNCLVVLSDGRMFMINRKHFIRYLGVSCNFSNTIIDGEYIDKDKNGNNISMFMAFDIYVLENVNVTKRIFNRSGHGSTEESRYELLQDLERRIELDLLPSNKFQFLVKKFYFGDDHKFEESISRQISELEISRDEELNKDDRDESRIELLNQQIKVLYQDTSIFEKAKFVYQKEYIYKIDGLIFTPTNLAVGEDVYTGKKNFNGRWFMNFKWKPPEENTIDFLVYFEKDLEDSKKDVISYITVNGKLSNCKTAILNVGYDPAIHTKYNACRVNNENLLFRSGYYPTKFYPTNPYSSKINTCKILLKNDMAICEDGSIIKDGSIVEFRYNNVDDNFIWTPLRTREVNTPNDYLTASNVWSSINNPVTTEMIIGDDPKLDMLSLTASTEEYYSSTKMRKELLSKPMNDLHSLIKKNLIKDNTNPNTNLLDISCGRLGDLNHWIDSNLSSVVGVDISKDNFDNIYKGACIRILNQQNVDTPHPLLNNIMLIWGDSSKNILNGDAGNDELNRYYLNVIYGRVGRQNITSKKLKLFHGMGKQGFDTVSCQFSIHYFFNNEESLDTLLENVSNSLKDGGKFLVTCLDGQEVFTRLKITPMLQGEIMGNTVWKINKKYVQEKFDDDSSSLGLEVDIYVESINQTLTEYLVNFNYLRDKARKQNLELVETKSFKDLYDTIKASDITYGDIKNINDSLLEYSYMNSILIFKKI